LSWSPSSGSVAGYAVYRDGSAIGTAGPDSTIFLDRDVTPSTTHTYSVGAVGTPHDHHAGRVTRIRPGSGSLARLPLHVADPDPDRARSGRRPADRVVQPVQRCGPGARLGQRQWPLDALGLDDVERNERHRPLLS